MDFRRLVSNGCHNRHRSPSEERYLKWLLFLFLSHRTSHDYSYLIFTEFVVFCYVFIPQVLLFFGHPSSFLHMSSVNWIISIATYRPRQFRFLFCCHAVRKNWLCILVDATSECVLYHLRIFFWQVYLLLLVCFRIHLLFFSSQLEWQTTTQASRRWHQEHESTDKKKCGYERHSGKIAHMPV